MLADFLSDSPPEDLIFKNPRGKNCGVSKWNYARNSLGLRDIFRYSRGWDIDASNDTEVRPRIYFFFY